MSDRLKLGLLVATAIVAVAVLAGSLGYLVGAQRRAAALNRAAGGAALPAGRRAPDYTLVNQLGQPVRSAQFRGKVQVVTFLFPYCTTDCPLIAAELVRFERTLREERLADRVQIVAFNLDPSGSGPPQMRAFMREYGWDPRDLRWQFLTGSPGDVKRVVSGGYMIDFERVSNAQEAREEARERAQGTYVPEPVVENALAEHAHVDYDVVHNDALEIVDPRGQIRRIYDEANKVDDGQLMAAVRSLLE